MKKRFWQLVLLMSVFFGNLGLIAHAENLNYSVSAELPKNQITDSVSYFDLKVTPGQTQDLTIRIKNSDSQAHTYIVSPNRAMTNDNGVIDYSQAKAKGDDSLKFDIKSALSPKQTVKVPAKTTKKVTIKLTVPKKDFSGIALGGINVIQEKSTDSSKKSSGTTIENQYAYVIGLQIREKAKIDVKPNMKLLQVKAQQINYRNYVTAQLENTEPVIMHGLKVKSYVTKAGSSKKVLTTDKENMAMAPNSNFNFAIGDGTKPLQAGKYTLHLTATSDKGKYKWNFTKNFTISQDKAKSLNKTTVEKPKSYFWWFVGLGALIVILLGLVIWLLIKNRRQNNDQ